MIGLAGMRRLEVEEVAILRPVVNPSREDGEHIFDRIIILFDRQSITDTCIFPCLCPSFGLEEERVDGCGEDWTWSEENPHASIGATSVKIRLGLRLSHN